MSKINKRFLLMLTLLTEICYLTLCSTVKQCILSLCIQGEYCDAEVCYPCPDGYYQQFRAHRETLCKKMTEKTGNGWRLIHPGNSSTDNQWGCDTDYYEYNNSGIIECREDVRQITTESDNTTTDSEKTNGTTITSTSSSESNSNDEAIIGGIIGGFIVLIAVGWLVYCSRIKLAYFLSKDKKSNNNNNKNNDSHDDNSNSNVYDESSIIKPNLDKINDDLKLDENLPMLELSEQLNNGYDKFNSLCIADENNTADIRGVLKNHEKKFGAHVLNIGQNTRHETSIPKSDDILLYEMSREKNYSDGEKKLNEAFEAMCTKLCEDHLGVEDGDYIKSKLNCHSDIEGKGYVLNFTNCLSKWSKNFHVSELEDGLWLPLSKLKGFLKDRHRNDILENYEFLTKEVMHLINELNKKNYMLNFSTSNINK